MPTKPEPVPSIRELAQVPKQAIWIALPVLTGGGAGPGSTSLPFSLRPPKELRLPYPALPTGRPPASGQG
jgi:hypothetical protein